MSDAKTNGMSPKLLFSPINLIRRSLSRTSLNLDNSELFGEDFGDGCDFAWINNVPSGIEFAININQIYSSKSPSNLTNRMIKLSLWLETSGIPLTMRTSKILHLREDPDVLIWQLESFDELIPLGISICKLIDKDIELVCEMMCLQPHEKVVKGSIKLFTDSGEMRSGLLPTILTGKNYEKHQEQDDEIKDLFVLEERLYRRKSKQVPNWHIQLMKMKLKELRLKICRDYEKEDFYVINLIVPTPSHPLRIKSLGESREVSSAAVVGDDYENDKFMNDLIESQEDSLIKRQYPQIFTRPEMSNGDLRAIRGILHRGFDDCTAIPADAANLLWTHRNFLARRFPASIVQFVESVQWWLSESDPSEIDEAFRVIDTWQFPDDYEEKIGIGMELLVAMCRVNGLQDGESWTKLFSKLCINASFSGNSALYENLQSTIILFIKRREKDVPLLCALLKQKVLFDCKTCVKAACELWWRLKVEEELESLRAEFEDFVGGEVKSEIRKQERLFEAIERTLNEAQKLKSNRQTKLETIKKGLNDVSDEGGVIFACQQQPFLPGLQNASEIDRVTSVISDRCTLFKSTAFTVLIVFMSPKRASMTLPVIFKRGDDLRRDAACLRVFRLIWDCWRREGGLVLFPKELLYGVTALKSDFGLVEYVESVPLSKIILQEGDSSESASDWAICKYLKSISEPESFNNFMRSCVGFSLLTYLLGIGDRHLDNLLLTPSGHLLHIDFSFVFGADPKPFPPPIKITREMVRGFDRDDESKWNEFKGLCFTALCLLRRRARLILAALQAEYPESSRDEVNFVKDRLALLVSQSESLQKFDKLLEDSRSAMFPQVMETIHKWVQYWKS